MPSKKCPQCINIYPSKLFSDFSEICIYCQKKSNYEEHEKTVFLYILKTYKKDEIEKYYTYMFHKYYFFYENFGEQIFRV
jgi:hypothetical protein